MNPARAEARARPEGDALIEITGRQAAKIARVALRDDIAVQVAELPTVNTVEDGQLKVALQMSSRPNTREVTITRWDVPAGPLWLAEITDVDWGGGDASVSQDVVLTEYDLSRTEVAEVVAQLIAVIGPGGQSAWWGNPRQYWRATGQPSAPTRAMLTADLHRWVDLVDQLRGLDDRPLRVPVAGWQEL